MNWRYKEKEETVKCNGKKWTKHIIELLINIHLEEFYHHCHRMTSSNGTAKGSMMSPERKSLLLTIFFLLFQTREPVGFRTKIG